MKKLTYKISGVDIDKANDFIRAIKGSVKKTRTAGVLADKGAFGSLFAPEMKNFKRPVLVSSTDGVGTKLLVAKAVDKHDTVGIDLVAMNVNDILCAGARPLFFLDYIACGRLNVRMLTDVIKGITTGCRQAGCALVGGETAEMPGMYPDDDYDLAGFAVGIVDRDKMIDGAKIRPGDRLIGLASNGLHSNGYSLVRRVFSLKEQKAMARELMRPTKIYVKEILALLEHFQVRGLAHMTGGAFYEKLTKILPPGLCFHVDPAAWPQPDIFRKIQKKGRIDPTEMFRTFNMGIGLVVVVAEQEQKRVCSFLRKKRIRAYPIGRVVRDKKNKVVFGRFAAGARP